MKAVSVITSVLILVAVGLGVKVYLDRREALEEYPIYRTITSTDGRQLDVVIHGRSESNLAVERLQDGQTFSLPFERLDAADREFAIALPVNRSSADGENPGAPTTARKPDDIYIENRLNRIEELRERLAALNSEIDSGNLTTSLQTVRESEKKRVEEEIESLRSAITQYKYRKGIK